MRPWIATAAGVAATALLAASAAATIVLRVTPRELADTANLVVEGRVAAVDVRWDDEHTCINRYVTFDVERAHKGTAGNSVVIKVPGGKVGDEEVRVEGTAAFAAGEEAVVFLWKDGRGEWIVLGEAQGKFLLTRDPATSIRRASNSLKGLCLVVRADPKSDEAAKAKKPDSLSYDDLVEVVKASVDAARRAGGTGTGGTRTEAEDGTGSADTEGEGRDPAPPEATPDPPSTKTPDGEAPPPTKDAPAPPAGKPVPPAGDEPKPASEVR